MNLLLLLLLPRAAANGIKHAKYQADNLLQDGTYLDAERQQALMRKNQRKKYPVQLPGCVTVGSDRHCRKEVKAPAKPTSRPSPPQRQKPWQGRQNHLTPTKQKHDLNATLVFTKDGIASPWPMKHHEQALLLRLRDEPQSRVAETFPGLLRGAGYPLQGARPLLIIVAFFIDASPSSMSCAR